MKTYKESRKLQLNCSVPGMYQVRVTLVEVWNKDVLIHFKLENKIFQNEPIEYESYKRPQIMIWMESLKWIVTPLLEMLFSVYLNSQWVFIWLTDSDTTVQWREHLNIFIQHVYYSHANLSDSRKNVCMSDGENDNQSFKKLNMRELHLA